MKRGWLAMALAAAVVAAGCSAPVSAPPAPPSAPGTAAMEPPPAPREFRAAWVASVANIDWPSKPGLPVARQQEEIRRIVALAAELRLNALVVQVRPAADALYASALEPWSEYLTGEQGRAPQPFYDPLQLWIEEARRHGLELHAWFNPYRARLSAPRSRVSPSHVSAVAPRIVKPYGEGLWMDPGEPESAQRTLAAIVDVVRRYDIDGVHLDDYFYPYPVKAPSAGANAPDVDFPDDASWQAYLLGGGNLSRADWRRQNVNRLVERLYAAIRQEKPWVRVGISPFGLGRPDRRPAGVTGFSQYDKLYADVELWMARGWLDYLAPQLYWPLDAPGQAFGVLLDYWLRENPQGRHVWPGLFTSKLDATPASWSADEIASQVALSRSRAGGHLHFSMAALLENRRGIADRLKGADYASPALVPVAPWLGGIAPAPPRVTARREAGGAVSLAVEADAARLFTVWAKHGEAWTFSTHPAGRALRLPPGPGGQGPQALVVTAVNRQGLESPRVRPELPREAGS